MAVIGGEISEITYNHPTIGQGFFFPKSDVDSTIDPGGLRNSDDASGVDAAGNTIKSLTRVRWSVETTVSNDMVGAQDIQRLAALAADPVEADFTFTHISGAVFSGKGSPVGDIQAAAKDGTMSLKISGGGVLQKI